ncbi:MAG: ATP-binding cassette domain-containing protein [Rhabdaerophilum sp.]
MKTSASILPLHVEKLAYEVEGKRLIDDVSFTLLKGGISVLIGPNGAGKSLALRLCHGLLKPASGHVKWALAGGERESRKRHGMVFQRPVMLRRSAAANIDHALKVTGFDNVMARREAVLARFGLDALASQPARLLSGGEQQRLAIARAFALEPDVLFLDEPSSQLDPGATRQIEEIITSLATEGVTILMTTHDLGQARRLASRVLFMHKGRLLADQPADDFFTAPTSAEARAFTAGDLLW